MNEKMRRMREAAKKDPAFKSPVYKIIDDSSLANVVYHPSDEMLKKMKASKTKK